MSGYRGLGKNVLPNKPQPNQRQPPQPALVIPHAPIGRRLVTAADKDLQRWRNQLDKEFPLLSPEDLTRSEQLGHMLMHHDMISQGDSITAQELNNIFRKEEKERQGGRYRHLMSEMLLKDDPPKLKRICETLRNCQTYNSQGHFEIAINLRKQLGEKFMHEGDIWLAKHFFLSCLSACKKLEYDDRHVEKVQAEVHCLMAFLARENNDNLESAMAIAIDHLARCRTLSQDMPWQFKPKVLTIKLKKPIAIHGLRFEEDEIYDIVDGCSMTVYMIATLLEHEMLVSLANQIMHTKKAPTEEEVTIAHEFADHALKLALEVRQPTALSSALVRFGLVLRHVGAYEDALTYFQQLKQHAVVTGDYTTEAIAYHNIGLCLIGCHNSIEAFECFAKQMDIASGLEMKDLEADALYEVGHLLLQEGHLWECEECYVIAFEDFKKMKHTVNHQLSAWTMLGVSAGHKLWARFSSTCRRNKTKDIYSLLDWKCCRSALSGKQRLDYKPELINRVYPIYVAKMKPQPHDDGRDHLNYEELADRTDFSFDSPKAKCITKGKSLIPTEIPVGDSEPQPQEFDAMMNELKELYPDKLPELKVKIPRKSLAEPVAGEDAEKGPESQEGISTGEEKTDETPQNSLEAKAPVDDTKKLPITPNSLEEEKDEEKVAKESGEEDMEEIPAMSVMEDSEEAPQEIQRREDTEKSQSKKSQSEKI